MFITRQRRFYNNVRKATDLICKAAIVFVSIAGFMLALTMC